MEEQKNDKIKQIDVENLLRLFWNKRKVYYKVVPVAFVLSCLFILCIPRYYKCTVSLAPELSNLGNSSLTDIASSFGFDLAKGLNSTDAILPELYPDVISSTNFMIQLFPIPVTTLDGSIKCSYYDYMRSHQKYAWWTHCYNAIVDLFKKKDNSNGNKINPFRLTKPQTDVIKMLSKKIDCEVDKKNYVISITVKDQDPLICATIADSVRVHLQNYITNYRTNKARNDLVYAIKIQKEAKARYEKSRQAYAAYADANIDVMLQSYRSKMEDLENEMQLQYNTYSTASMQMQTAQAKVQESTPAFTTLQGATVPIKPDGPKRMIFVLIVTILAIFATSSWIVWRENKKEQQ